MASDGRPRPIALASHRNAGWTVVGALLPGAILLATVVQAGQPITPAVGAAAALAVLLPLAAAEKARRGTVRQAEDETTPTASPRNNAGQVLRPRDADTLAEAMALIEDAVDALAEQQPDDAPAPPPRPVQSPPPTATRGYPAVGAARSMRAWPPDDWVGDRAHAHDEQQAARRGQDPAVRTGRDIADRADRTTAGRQHARRPDGRR